MRETTPAPLTAAVREHLLAVQPQDVAALDSLLEAAWQTADPILLELCRLRIAAMLGDRDGVAARTPQALAAGLEEATVAALADWDESERFGPRERAALAFAEQFATSVAHVSDQEVDALLEHLSEQEVYSFASALYVVDMEMRLRLMAGALLGAGGPPA